MRKQDIAILTVAIGLCIAITPQLKLPNQPAQTSNPPKVTKPITTTNSVNPYQDAIDNQYQTTDESLSTIDQTYGQPQPKLNLPKNVKITIEVADPETVNETAKQ